MSRLRRVANTSSFLLYHSLEKLVHGCAVCGIAHSGNVVPRRDVVWHEVAPGFFPILYCIRSVVEGRVDVRLSTLLAVYLAFQVVGNLFGRHLLKLLGCKYMTQFIGATKDEGNELDMW